MCLFPSFNWIVFIEDFNNDYALILQMCVMYVISPSSMVGYCECFHYKIVIIIIKQNAYQFWVLTISQALFLRSFYGIPETKINILYEKIYEDFNSKFYHVLLGDEPQTIIKLNLGIFSHVTKMKLTYIKEICCQAQIYCFDIEH